MRAALRNTGRAAAALALLGVYGLVQAGGCTVNSSGMAFGFYQPLTFAAKRASVDRTSDATVSLVCTGISVGGSYTLSLGPSSAGNSISPRYLANGRGGPDMAFNIYREASYSTVWGDGTGGAVFSGSIPLGDSTQTHVAYGKVPAGQSTLRVGSYSASLVMTVTYNP